MKNTDVLTSFLKGNIAHTANLQTDGNTLINYTTRIAYKKGNNLMINSKKYSVTTSKIQTQLLRLALETYRNGNIIFYEEV